MTRVFFDASALFAAAHSVTGAARAILEYAPEHEVVIVVSEEVVDEVFRNIRLKAHALEPAFREFRESYEMVYVEPSDTDLEVAGYHTKAKDIHVVAAAMTAKCSLIISHDKAHLVGNMAIEENCGVKAVTPGDFLAIMRST